MKKPRREESKELKRKKVKVEKILKATPAIEASNLSKCMSSVNRK